MHLIIALTVNLFDYAYVLLLILTNFLSDLRRLKFIKEFQIDLIISFYQIKNSKISSLYKESLVDSCTQSPYHYRYVIFTPIYISILSQCNYQRPTINSPQLGEVGFILKPNSSKFNHNLYMSLHHITWPSRYTIALPNLCFLCQIYFQFSVYTA